MQRCEIVAEIGWSHLGDINLARQMIEASKNAGADYAKFQTWRVKNLKPGPWDSDGRREIYEKAELSEKDHHALLECCNDNYIKFLTSCFNVNDLEFIRSLTNEVKIPSTECFNGELVSKAISLFDRVFISTGATYEGEYMRWAHKENVYLLHCISSYPCPARNVNLPRLLRLKHLTPRFGYSGHFDGPEDAIAAISMGAKVVEKHFTIDKALPGRDNKFALLPEQLQRVTEYATIFAEMNKDLGGNFQECEKEAREKYARRWALESSKGEQ